MEDFKSVKREGQGENTAAAGAETVSETQEVQGNDVGENGNNIGYSYDEYDSYTPWE